MVHESVHLKKCVECVTMVKTLTDNMVESIIEKAKWALMQSIFKMWIALIVKEIKCLSIMIGIHRMKLLYYWDIY